MAVSFVFLIFILLGFLVLIGGVTAIVLIALSGRKSNKG